MLHFLFLSLICVTAWTAPAGQSYSYSLPVGTVGGTSFSTDRVGHITGIRLWEHSYIRGIQFRYDFDWGPVYGRELGTAQEMELDDDETIIQISGKHNGYIQQMMFTTSKGRSIFAGQFSGTSFNFYPEHSEHGLLFVSGQYNSNGVGRFGAHWGTVNLGNSSTTQ